MSQKRKKNQQKRKKQYDGKATLIKNKLAQNQGLPYNLFKKWTPAELYSALEKSLTKEYFEGFFQCSYTGQSIRKLGKNRSFIPISDSHDLSLICVILKLYLPELERFESYYSSFQTSYIHGEHEKCLSALNLCNDELGYSKWLLSNEFLVIQNTKGLEKQKLLLKDLKSDQLVDFRVKSLSFFYSLKVENEISWDRYFNNYLRESIEVSKKRNQLSSSTILFYELNIGNSKSFLKKDLQAYLDQERDFSVYDLYLAFIKISLITLTKFPGSKLHKDIKQLLSVVSKHFSYNSFLYRLSILYKVSFYTMTETDEALLKSLDQYTEGNYKKTSIENTYLSNCAVHLESFELTARSMRWEKESPSIVNSINHSINSLIRKDKKLLNSYDSLLKESLKNLNTGLSYKILSLISRESGEYNTNDFIYYDLASFIFTGSFNPRILSHHNSIRIDKCSLTKFRNSTTYNLFLEHSLKDNSDVAQNIPKYRILKYKALNFFRCSKFKEAKYLFLDSLNLSRTVDRYSLLKNLAICHIKLGELNECTQLIVSECIDNEELISTFPIPLLVKHLSISDLQYSEAEAINVAILFDYYLKYFSSSKDIEENRAFAFEDFLEGSDTKRPSQIDYKKLQTEKPKLVYFLYNICTPDIMDVSVHFDTPESLLEERIKVLSVLSTINPNKEQFYRNEIQELTFDLIVDKKIVDTELGQVRINKSGVVSDISKAISDDYRRIISLKSVKHYQDDELIQYVLELMQPDNETNSLTKEILQKAKDSFLFGINGLDVNLSVDIRHGTLENILKRSLKEYKLMVLFNGEIPDFSEIDLDYLDSHQKTIFCKALTKLSSKVNLLVRYLLRKVVRAVDKSVSSNGYIYINSGSLDIIRVRNLLQSAEDLDKASNILIDYFWTKVEPCLESIRDKLNIDISNSISTVFHSTIKDLESRPELTGIKQINSLKLAHTKLSDDIKRASRWFNKASIKEVDDFDVKLASEIARRTIQNYDPTLNSINVKTSSSTKNKIAGSDLKSLTSIFEIAYTNAIQHSGLSPNEVCIDLSYKREEQFLKLKVRNNLASNTNYNELKIKIEKIKQKIGEEGNTLSIRSEKGSGIPKAFNIIKNQLRKSGEINFYIDKGEFVLELSLGVTYV